MLRQLQDARYFGAVVTVFETSVPVQYGMSAIPFISRFASAWLTPFPVNCACTV